MKQNMVLYSIMFCFAFILTASATSAWANVAANTQIIAQAHLSYYDGETTQTATASITVTVGLVAAGPNIESGPAQSASYAGAGTSLTDSFTITAQSNGPDTYTLSAAVADSTNTNGATATPNVNSVVLGATLVTDGSTATLIAVPADGLADNSVNGIEVGDTVRINNETRTVSAINDKTGGKSSITLNAPLGVAPGVGVMIAEQKIVTATVTAGTITTAGTDVTVAVTLSGTSVSDPGVTTTSASIPNTFSGGLVTFTKYVRNVSTPSGSGTSYMYNAASYYLTGVTAKRGDILEYLLVAANTGSGTVSTCVVSDALSTTYVSLNTGGYSGSKDIAYVDETGAASYLTAAPDADSASYATPMLSVNAGSGATNVAGGNIAAGKSILVLYRVTVSNSTQGDKIVSSAQLSSPDITPASSAVTVTVVNRTAAVVEMLNHALSLAGAHQINIALAAYQSGSATGPFVSLPAPVPVGNTTPIDVSQPVPLSPATQLHQGDPLFISVTDTDQNLDTTQAETVFVTFSNSANSDREVIRLTETGSDTGVFAGYVPTSSTSSSVASYNGSLSVDAGDNLMVRYVDSVDGSDATAQSMLVDPYGIVLDSSTGEPVSDATITIQTATGEPATVYGDDGISTFPATITSGGTVTDSSGRAYSFPVGEYRFPFLMPGDYRYLITPPAGYGAPSTVATATIQALPGGPFTIVPGSRGETFVINAGPAVRIDIPIDPFSSTLWLQKSAGKEFAGHGDFIPYRLTLTNVDALVAATGVMVVDTLPIGFRLRKGSIRIDGHPGRNPSVSANGRTLRFSIGTLSGGAVVTIDYVAEVTVGARLGQAVNSARAATAGVRSNIARATVTIRDDFLRTHSTLMGRVTTGTCNEETGEGSDGVEGVRIYLEDGTFVISDKRGLFHFEGVRDGLHVVQLDIDSLPEGYEPFACTENSRYAGRAFSQFVETRGGALWRTDFHIRPRMEPASVKPAAGNSLKDIIGLEFTNATEGESITYRASIQGGILPVRETRLNITLPEGIQYKPGSSAMDGVAIPDPLQADKTNLVFKLNEIPAGQCHTITFSSTLSGGGKTGMLVTQAYLVSDGDTKAAVVTPPSETIVQLDKKVERFQMPEIVLRPYFPVLGTELDVEDRKELDNLAEELSGLYLEKIQVSGHTQNFSGAANPRAQEKSNQELSLARARTVGRYLMDKLQIPPEKLYIEGKGDTTPVADNRTKEGRALNRRVEVRITCIRIIERSQLRVIQEHIATQRADIGAPMEDPEGVAAENGVKAQIAPGPATPKTADAAQAQKTPEGVTIKDPEGILSPDDNDILPNPINGVRVCLDSRLKPRLLVDDKEVATDRIGFTMKDEKALKTLYSYIGVDFGLRGEHVVQLQGIDPFGNIRFKRSISVMRSGEIVSIRLQSAEGNVADGITPVKLKLEIFDADGTRIPAEGDLEIREGTLSPMKQPDNLSTLPAEGSHAHVHMSRDGEVLFQPVTNSGLYRVVLAYNDATLEAETYVQPKIRDWILVGLAEGTMGYNTAKGNMENLRDAGLDEDLYENGRVALFAKGQIKGKWLLTMSYDSDKPEADRTNGLFQTIDPDTYYTLYGDATQQQYDAASAKKLYIKMEREQFYALFGDYDTAMTVTELSRYSRRMTGMKTEMQTKNFELNAFGSQTDQVYGRDEFPGDGTSGIYRLSRKNILPNTEKITIEVRGRFQSEKIISSRVMGRFTDYSIDYDSGAVIFKEPIYSKDENLNPIMIVAEYEILSEGGQDYTYGGRAGVKLLDNKVKAGGSYIHEGQGERDSNLYGMDTSFKLDQFTKLRAEFATSDYADGSQSHSGNAYLAEVSRTSKAIEAKAYYREQESGFGLGQQPGSEAGTRKFGVEGAYNLRDGLATIGNIYRQYNLETDATRDVAEGRLNYYNKRHSAYVGFLHAQDDLDDGDSYESNQVTLGGKVPTLYDRLSLTLDYAQSIGTNENSDFPSRVILGADYKATQNLTLLAAQEFTWGEYARTQTSRVGLRSGLWQGASLTSGLEREFNENSQRVFATAGLKQTWQINSAWKMDAGLDRNQTIASSENYQFNTNVPSASGSHEDFTAVSSGVTYQVKHLIWDSRAEVREADSEDKWGLMSGIIKEIDDSWAWTGRTRIFQTAAETSTGSDSTKADLRLGMVYRPAQTQWIMLDRLDFLIDKQSGGISTDFSSWRFINNLIANYRPRKGLQLSLHYGAKYVLETIYENDYRGFTDLLGAEGRYDINENWDIGLHGSLFHSWHAGQFDYCSGASIGYNVVRNAWISLGYNLTGFNDRDFSRANFTAKGPFVRFRFKFDQDSVRDAATWLKDT